MLLMSSGDSSSARPVKILRLLRWHGIIWVALIILIAATFLATIVSTMHKDQEVTEKITVTEFEPYSADMPYQKYVSGEALVVTGSFAISSGYLSSKTYYIILSEEGEEGYIYGDSPAFTAFRDSSFAFLEDISKPFPEAFVFQGKTRSFPTDLTPGGSISLPSGIGNGSGSGALSPSREIETEATKKNRELLQSIKGKSYVELDYITDYQTVTIPADPIYQTVCNVLWGALIVFGIVFLMLRDRLEKAV